MSGSNIHVPGFSNRLNSQLPKTAWTADGKFGLCPTTGGEIILCDDTGTVASKPLTQEEAAAFFASLGGDPSKAPNIMQRWNDYTQPGGQQRRAG